MEQVRVWTLAEDLNWSWVHPALLDAVLESTNCQHRVCVLEMLMGTFSASDMADGSLFSWLGSWSAILAVRLVVLCKEGGGAQLGAP